jgi:hypothetical protein
MAASAKALGDRDRACGDLHHQISFLQIRFESEFAGSCGAEVARGSSLHIRHGS